MVIVHEIRDEDEDFDAQLIDDYTTDDGEYEEGSEFEGTGFNGKANRGPLSFLFGFVPMTVRSKLSNLSKRALSASLNLAKMTGKAAWILTTSLLLIGLPLLYVYDREKSLVEYEKEQQRFAPPVASS